MNNRYYMVFNVSEVDKVDFNEVLEQNKDQLRISVDGTKTLVKWNGNTVPSFFDSFTTKEGPYTYEEMFAIIQTPEWTIPYPKNN